jgi:tripartite-type tricarboxylate transporter receptor subunit TctC
MFSKKITTLFSTLILAFAFLTSAATAGYPDRVINLIVPFGTGGSTDTNARLLAAELEEELGQRIIVKNISGAAGLTGTKAVADAKPNGYTFGYLPPAVLVMHPHVREVAYTIDDFAPVAVAVSFPYTLFTQKEGGFTDLEDMINKMQADSSKYFVGSTGVGSMPYFAIMGLLTHFNISPQLVQFKTDGDAMSAMMGNRISIYASTPMIAEMYEAKPLVVLDNKRSSFMPDVPCIREFGQNMNFVHWQAVMAPKGTPKEIIKKFSTAIKNASQKPEYKKTLAKIRMAPDYKTPEETQQYIQDQNEMYKVVTKQVMDAIKAQN